MSGNPRPDPTETGHPELAIADPEAAERAEKILREHDSASRFRTDLGIWGWIIGPLAIGLTIFQLYTALFGTRPSLIQGAIHVGAATGLIFLLYPARKGMPERRGVPWYDVVLALGVMAANLYILVEYDHLTGNEVRVLGYNDTDHIVAALGIVLILEAARRCVGLPIVIVAGCAILYSIFGENMPIFAHRGYSWGDFATESFFTSRSVFGTPIQVSSTFVFLFLFFGVLLTRTKIENVFNDLAYRATGRYSGGPAKAAVVSSGLQGMVSGSSVANTVGSGAFTIPMMKRAGFKPHFAAAAEASSSTGGQIMPPVMGAAAFIMAEYTGVPYNDIIVMAAVPAVMFFTGVFMSIHFEARRQGIKGAAKKDLPSWRSVLTRIDLLLPLVVIVFAMQLGRTPATSALWGIGAAFVLSFIRSDTRLSFMGIVRLLEGGARIALPVIAACATAGIVAGTVTATGLGGKLASGLLDLAFGEFYLVLIFTMIACLILGMGMPTTANYVVTATIAAPILLNEFDVPVIAAHLFVFYFGILADITPPVCLASYAGAGIAGANPMKTGITSVRIAIAAFIIPYVFVAQPELLLQDTSVGEFIPVLVSSLLGMLAIAAGMAGHLVRRATPPERVLLVAAGVALISPNLVVGAVGLAVLIGIGVVQRTRRGEPEVLETPA